MKYSKSIGFVVLLLVLLTAFGVWQTQTLRMAPEVSFKTLQGETIELKSLRGKTVLVTFWASDCASCIEEIPHLVNLQQRFAADVFSIIAVAMPYDVPNRVLALTQSRQIPYPVALDPSGALTQSFGGVRLTPSSFLIGPAGQIAWQKTGIFEPDEMQARISQLIAGNS